MYTRNPYDSTHFNRNLSRHIMPYCMGSDMHVGVGNVLLFRIFQDFYKIYIFSQCQFLLVQYKLSCLRSYNVTFIHSYYCENYSKIHAKCLYSRFVLNQISYFATTPELSDNITYKYFKRTVPSDTFQTKALVSILRWVKSSYCLTGQYDNVVIHRTDTVIRTTAHFKSQRKPLVIESMQWLSNNVKHCDQK